MTDLIITWPKKRSLQSYLDACQEAHKNDSLIHFRVSRAPKDSTPACKVYVVHDGFIRGYHILKSVDTYSSDTVQGFYGEQWGAGTYLTRYPFWHRVEPVAMAGFRGFRYSTR